MKGGELLVVERSEAEQARVRRLGGMGDLWLEV